MSADTGSHPSRDQLAAFSAGKLNAVDSEAIQRHLAECESCSQILSTLPGGDTPVPPLRDPETDGSDALELPPELRDHPRYRIVEVLGRGGMGVVFRAEDRVMDRPVAIKVIKPRLVQNAAAARRFRREVRAAAGLDDPRVVTVYNAERAGDLRYLVMEFVDGVDLDTVIRRRGALPVEEACRYIREAAEGLRHAHEFGMVHRDIKPRHLMVAGYAPPAGSETQPASAPEVRPAIKILDFGLANFLSETAKEGPDPANPEHIAPAAGATDQLTQTGTAAGTPGYVAPEQAQNARTADIRGDIYSLGCTFYTLLAGQVPFGEGSAAEKIKSHAQQDAPSLSRFREGVPRELEAILQKMMAKDPADRYQTPAEVVDALAPFVGAAPRAEQPPAWGRRHTFVAAGVLLVLAAVIAVATSRGRVDSRSEVQAPNVTVPRPAVEDVDVAVPRPAFEDVDVAVPHAREETEAPKPVTQSTAPLPGANGKEPTYFDDFGGESVIAGPPLGRGRSDGALYFEPVNGRRGSFAWWRQPFSGGVLEVTGRVVEGSAPGTGWIVNLAQLAPHSHGVRFVVFGDGHVLIGRNMFDADRTAGPRLQRIAHAAIKPAGQWNTLRIGIDGDVVQVWMNSERIGDPIRLDSSIAPGHVALGVQCPGINAGGRVEITSLAIWDTAESPATGRATEPAPTAANTEQKLARWVQEVGGEVTVTLDGRTDFQVAATEELPKEPLWLRAIDFDENDERLDANDLDKIAALPHLRELNLWGVPLSDAQLSCVSNLTGLEVLFLIQTPVTDDGLVHLSQLSNLKRLHVESTRVTDRGIAQLARLEYLEELRLEDTKVTDVGLERLKALPRLYWLGLDGTAVTDRGLAQLGKMPNLTMLHLNRTAVTDAGLVHLEALPNLTVLLLEDTNVSADGVQRLQTVFPDCRIEH